MGTSIISREQVAQRLSVSTARLLRYEQRGLIRCEREGTLEGYSVTECRRLWTVVSLQRDLGINLAGVEAVLHLRDQIQALHVGLAQLVREMDESPDSSSESHDDNP